MCTAITLANGGNFYFGRNLDLDVDYGNEVVVCPRNYEFKWRFAGEMKNHYAMIGMAMMAGDYPLYFDGTNEKGLSIAGLNFRNNAHYYEPKEGMTNITSFEIIPWVLGNFASVEEAREALKNTNMTPTAFSPQLEPASMHWIISDDKESIVVEPLEGGLKIWDDPVGVLTNNPQFDYHIKNLINYMNLTPLMPKNNFAEGLDLKANGVGVGTFGLPGGYDGVSRFVRAAFAKWNAVMPENTEDCNVNQFFRIMNAVAVPRGCAMEPTGQWMITQYSSCVNTKKGIYYLMTYKDYQINGIDMFKENLDDADLKRFPLPKGENILMRN